MNINALLYSLSEGEQNKIAMIHDQARGSYLLPVVKIRNWQECEYYLGDYYKHHCNVVGGGDFGNPGQNLAEAKELAVRGAERKTTIKKLFRDAITGSNGGMRQVLDNLANAIRQKYIERYIADTFDSYIAPCSIDESTEIMRQFLLAYQHILPSHIDVNRPEYYASNYKEYIGLFAESMTSIASKFCGL